MSENTVTTTAPAPAAPTAAAPAKPGTATKMAVAPKGATRKEAEIIKRMNDRASPNSLYNVIFQMSGGDKLFMEKFVMYCKAQVDKHWKRVGNEWTNPYLLIPLNSQLEALYKCARRKVLPDGYNCNLVPYLGKDPRVEVSVDYKGLIDCAIRDRIILDCDAKEVCANDDFAWSMGEVERWRFDPRKDRGEICGYCAWAVLPDGRKKWSYMSLEEIAAVRSCAKTDMIWSKWEGEMSKKSAIRRLFKTMRNSPALTNLMELDNEAFEMEQGADGTYAVKPEGGRPARRNATPVRQITGAAQALPAPQEQGAEEAQVEMTDAEPEPVFA